MKIRCYKCLRKGCDGRSCDCAFNGRRQADLDAILWATCPTHDGRPIFRIGQCRHFIDAFLDHYEAARQSTKKRMAPGPAWDELKKKHPELWDKYK